MAITIEGTYPATYDIDQVYDEQGYGRIITFEEEAEDGTKTPIDLTNWTPITYSVQKSNDNPIFEKTIPDGQTSGDGMVIQGTDNDELSISIPASDTLVGARNYRHELELTRADGAKLVVFIGNLHIRNINTA